jgi:hypothetical protein
VCAHLEGTDSQSTAAWAPKAWCAPGASRIEAKGSIGRRLGWCEVGGVFCDREMWEKGRRWVPGTVAGRVSTDMIRSGVWFGARCWFRASRRVEARRGELWAGGRVAWSGDWSPGQGTGQQKKGRGGRRVSF